MDSKAPGLAKGEITSTYWAVAWWATSVEKWYLDSERKYSKEEAETYRVYLESLDPEILHRVVKVTSQFSFAEV